MMNGKIFFIVILLLWFNMFSRLCYFVKKKVYYLFYSIKYMVVVSGVYLFNFCYVDYLLFFVIVKLVVIDIF